jgi:hypothetical protein
VAKPRRKSRIGQSTNRALFIEFVARPISFGRLRHANANESGGRDGTRGRRIARLVDCSFDLYFGPKAPAGKEGDWIKTIPGKGWFTFCRIHGPQAPAFDGSWKLNDIEVVK